MSDPEQQTGLSDAEKLLVRERYYAALQAQAEECISLLQQAVAARPASSEEQTRLARLIESYQTMIAEAEDALALTRALQEAAPPHVARG